MRTEKSDIALSLNGRDGGKCFLVIGTEDGYSLLADGKTRKADRPKRKKNKHLRLVGKAEGPTAAKLLGGEKVTNNEIRRVLAQYAAREKGGM